MTILIHFHQFHYRYCKAFYLWQVCRHYRGEFPNLLSYHRFMAALIPTTLVSLCLYLYTCRGQSTGLAPVRSDVHRVNVRHLPDFTVDLRPSRYLLIAGSIAHLWAMIAVLIAAIPLWLKVSLSIGLGLVLIGFWIRKGQHRRQASIVRIAWIDGRWHLETRSGVLLTADLIDGYGHPYLIILNFRLATNRRCSLTLLPDSARPDSLRRLRVLLRIRREAETVDDLHR